MVAEKSKFRLMRMVNVGKLYLNSAEGILRKKANLWGKEELTPR